jgi:hypothetical protein
MRHYVFYLACGLLTFGFGLFISIGFYSKTVERSNDIKSQSPAKIADKKNDLIEPVFYQTAVRPADDKREIKEIPVCRDKKLAPLWNELKKDKEFRERVEGFYKNVDCTDLFDVKKIDLNNDGQKEFVLWGNNDSLCGATGNCAIWIYEKKNSEYKLLLQSYAYRDGENEWFEVKNLKSNGYRNLLLKGHFTRAETIYHFYKFNGAKYVEDNCLMYKYTLDEKKPSIMTCREHSQKIDREVRENEKRLEKQ